MKRLLHSDAMKRLGRYLCREKIAILMYHGFADERIDESIYPYLNVEIFRSQMRYLKKYYNVISLDQLVEHYTSGIRIPNNSVIITMDDGHESNYTLAYPVLKQFDVPATIFLTTDYIDNKRDFLKWHEVLEMIESGIVSIGSHTCTHAVLTRCSPENMKKELFLSKQLIEKKTGLTCRFFCYPRGGVGDFDHRTKKLLKELGYSCGLTTVIGMNDERSDIFELKRLGVRNQGGLTELAMVLSYGFESVELTNYFSTILRSITMFLKGGKAE